MPIQNQNPCVITLDLSSTCTGWAVGLMGNRPQATGSIRMPKGDHTDAEKFLFYWEAIKAKFIQYGCQFLLAEELNHFTNARTARLLAGLAGAISVLAKKELQSEVLYLNTAKCRSAIDVRLGWDEVEGKKVRPDVKKRVAERLEHYGIYGLPEDEADACVILLAAGKLAVASRSSKSIQPHVGGSRK